MWPAMLSCMARAEIKVVRKLHGGKIFDAITKLHHIYFGFRQGDLYCKWPSIFDLNLKIALL